MLEEKLEEKCTPVLIVLISSGRLVAMPPGGMMSVLWPGSQPARHKHGEVQKRGKVLEQIINSCELPDKRINVLPGLIYIQYWLSHVIVRAWIPANSAQTWGGPKEERMFWDSPLLTSERRSVCSFRSSLAKTLKGRGRALNKFRFKYQ